jgi:hypothetical protein
VSLINKVLPLGSLFRLCRSRSDPDVDESGVRDRCRLVPFLFCRLFLRERLVRERDEELPLSSELESLVGGRRAARRWGAFLCEETSEESDSPSDLSDFARSRSLCLPALRDWSSAESSPSDEESGDSGSGPGPPRACWCRWDRGGCSLRGPSWATHSCALPLSGKVLTWEYPCRFQVRASPGVVTSMRLPLALCIPNH